MSSNTTSARSVGKLRSSSLALSNAPTSSVSLRDSTRRDRRLRAMASSSASATRRRSDMRCSLVGQAELGHGDAILSLDREATAAAIHVIDPALHHQEALASGSRTSILAVVDETQAQLAARGARDVELHGAAVARRRAVLDGVLGEGQEE